jgi:putative heme-binding domain-containing protein
VKEAALRALIADAGRTGDLLAAVENEKLERWSVSSTRRRQLMRHSDAAIAARAKKLFGDSFAGARRDVYEQYRPALRQAGDVARGKQVFGRVCADCHKIGEAGNAVGPDLLSVVIRNKEVLMTDILLPNESIEAGYEEYLVDTKDGRSISGVIAAESAAAVTLRRAKGEEDTIARDNIAELRSLNVSAMPEDLEKQIAVEEMADLLAYLKSL